MNAPAHFSAARITLIKFRASFGEVDRGVDRSRVSVSRLHTGQ